jgi:Mg2+/Co2+ transporter CorB
MTDSDILVLLVALLCVALSFLFSGMETGVLALNRFRIRQRMRSGDRRAALLHGFLQNPEDFLWTILVGNTVVNFVLFSLGVMQLRHWLGNRRLAEASVLIAGVFIFYVV